MREHTRELLVDPHFVRSTGAASPSRPKTQKGLPSFSREIVALLKRPDVRRLLTSVAAREAGGGQGGKGKSAVARGNGTHTRTRTPKPPSPRDQSKPDPQGYDCEACGHWHAPGKHSKESLAKLRARRERQRGEGANPASAKKKKPKVRGGANHANEDEEPDAAKDSPSRSEVVGALSEALVDVKAALIADGIDPIKQLKALNLMGWCLQADPSDRAQSCANMLEHPFFAPPRLDKLHYAASTLALG